MAETLEVIFINDLIIGAVQEFIAAPGIDGPITSIKGMKVVENRKALDRKGKPTFQEVTELYNTLSRK